MAGARPVGAADPAERLEVTILVRRKAADAFSAHVARLARNAAPVEHIAREDFARQFGADPGDLAAVKSFANDHGLAVVQEDAARRTINLSGTVAQFQVAFGVQLQRYEYDGGSYRGRTGTLQLPAALTGIVEAVLGLDNRPQAKPHFRISDTGGTGGTLQPHAVNAAAVSFTPPQVASLYKFPAGTGQGQAIAIIELGGGYKPADIQQYFAELNVTPPAISSVSIDHGENQPTGSADGPDGEVLLDIEVAGSIAPGAKIVVYFAPNTDAGFIDAVTTAAHDSVNNPSVISISWGGPENSWTQQATTALDQAFQAAAAMGVTVCAASGDNGSSDGVTGGTNNVDFPASSPFALACGGTSIQASNGSITSESTWNDGAAGGATGGGVSSVFPLPAWQTGLNTLGSQGASAPLAARGVPDVSADADPESGYIVRVDGTEATFGGTSAVAPLWAALIARINSSNGSTAGYVNPKLYSNPAALNDITVGNNGAFAATTGWDACTGLGSPNGGPLALIL
ncbi:MAG TPA: S53 family peptidase [Candidatus Baltobacteraceae bacterium]|nr:S53 family peptidase [Candidatus Baltobacteraceae bacterium]